ncbi:MAG: glutathione S-transferase [Planctomycetota bacterium]|jgi:glutathione S-transferase
MTEPLPVLYSFRRCPYAMRARLALSVSGQEVEHREVDLKDRPEELRTVSPKATVPVLVLADGTVLEESLEIMHWALGNADPEAWLHRTPELVELTGSLIHRNDGDFKFHLDRYKYATRYEDVDAEEHRAAASVILRDLETRLKDSPFLTGSAFTMADAAIAPFVRQFAFADRTWFDAQDWPQLGAWLDTFLSSSRFQGIMRKFPVWNLS